MSYRIEYLRSVVVEDVPKLSGTAKQQIRKVSEGELTAHPVEFGKPLRYSLKGARSLRVGDDRVIYRIETRRAVLILTIGHRKEVYAD